MKHPSDLHRSHRALREWDGHRAASRRRRYLPHRAIGWRSFAGMVLTGLTGGVAWTMFPAWSPATPGARVPVEAPASPDAPAVRANFTLCHSGGGANCVVDGDTFWMGGIKIRIADIDTPETHPARCAREAELGAAATSRLHDLLNSGAVSLEAIGRDADRYGRKLRIVSIDGRRVGETLVAEGLARRYAGGNREGWCA